MKILVDYNSLLERINNGRLRGKTGVCLVKDGLIYKVYFLPNHNASFFNFSRYKSDSIAFPFHYLYDYKMIPSERIVGEVMPYFVGKPIEQSITGNIDVRNLIENYLLMVLELKKFPEIIMRDLVSVNILYNEKNGFSLIDTSDWVINEKGNYTKINKRFFDFELSNFLLDTFLGLNSLVLDDYNFRNNLMRFGKNGIDLLNALQSTFDDDCQFVEILSLYCLVFEKSGFEPVVTLDDMKKYTKKLQVPNF